MGIHGLVGTSTNLYTFSLNKSQYLQSFLFSSKCVLIHEC